MAGDARITNTSLKFAGLSYFRANAPSVVIGSFGDKKTPLTKQNYIEVLGRIPVARLKVHRATTARIDFTGTSSVDLAVDVSVPISGSDTGMGTDMGTVPRADTGTVTLSPSVAYEQLRHDQLCLVKLDIYPSDIIKAANDSPAVLAHLKECGDSGRLVHQIFMILKAKTAKVFSSSTSLALSATNGEVMVTAQGSQGSTGDLTLRLSYGTTFAYLLLKLKWDAHQKKNWKRITGSEDDQQSLD
ncbi:hypothetical protein [Pyxidicoccus sp. MSG2]|uniref:hypothetical protein n=1 Tax=Pyxidicoccus sp. MSG2 TaxID=2996790 RepID=UPI002271EC23|nr:hypothetical protein [Pyxidicoccus sp. MSG2]MCY1015860.1 hypothetical protein [Pyxidicoccus sp. MSG2]